MGDVRLLRAATVAVGQREEGYAQCFSLVWPPAAAVGSIGNAALFETVYREMHLELLKGDGRSSSWQPSASTLPWWLAR